MPPETTEPDPLDVFNGAEAAVETELSGDDFLNLCADSRWRVVWMERRGNARWYVKAVRAVNQSASQAQARMPYKDD